MTTTPPPLLDEPPCLEQVTEYDLQHSITYLRLLDAAAEGANWREVSSLVLGLDPQAEPERARRVHDRHLERARWMTRSGYRDLLKRSQIERG